MSGIISPKGGVGRAVARPPAHAGAGSASGGRRAHPALPARDAVASAASDRAGLGTQTVLGPRSRPRGAGVGGGGVWRGYGPREGAPRLSPFTAAPGLSLPPRLHSFVNSSPVSALLAAPVPAAQPARRRSRAGRGALPADRRPTGQLGGDGEAGPGEAAGEAARPRRGSLSASFAS